MNYKEMTFNLTTDEKPFLDLDCPPFMGYACSNIKIPNIFFNQTYYKVDNKTNSLVAFRVLAISITKKNGWYYPCYLIQLPNGETNWYINYIEENRTKLFSSVEHYTHYVANVCNSLHLEFISVAKIFDKFINYPNKASYHDMLSFYYTYKWNDHIHKAQKCETYITYLLITESGLSVCTNHYNRYDETNYYGSEEECVKSKLNGMKIIDFNDKINIEIKIQPTNKPKIHVLKFIED